MRRTLLVLALVALLPACFHATVATGLRPGTVKIENKWAGSWIGGLVPPDAVETMRECPAGVARVETRVSFLNQVVWFFTLGIYSPMEIIVTCAYDGGDGLPEATNDADAMKLLNSGIPFLVNLD
jgi:hypothetical protein